MGDMSWPAGRKPSDWRKALLRTACCTPLFLLPHGARAQGVPSSAYSSYGQTGTDAEANLFSANVPSTPGGDGGSANVLGPSGDIVSTGVAIRVESTGGRGGNGAIVRVARNPAAAGGAGGNVSLLIQNAVSGFGDQDTNAAQPRNPLSQANRGFNPPYLYTMDSRWTSGFGTLVLVFSQGGDGGIGEQLSAVGAGGNGGSVSATVNANLTTQGAGYGALWVRSLGGNSGFGGVETEEEASRKGGGYGGTVTVSNTATISTNGANAPAVVAESLGGAGSILKLEDARPDYVTPGGAGRDVSVANSGTISTKGMFSSAIIAQSVGGVGGLNYRKDLIGAAAPGGAGGNGQKVVVANAGKVATDGLYSFGILALSVGGSGGAGANVIVGRAGAGGSAGAGSAVTVVNSGTITTMGDGATAIAAQSIGGGNATDAFMAAPLTPGGSGGGGSGGSAFIGKGGAGGAGGDGGAVTVQQGGGIATKGQSAYGILAQSVGGGGGAGGEAAGALPFFGFSLGGRGAGGGDGGLVRVDRTPGGIDTVGTSAVPFITTVGDGATGILAQSIGGGGGAGGTASAKSVGLIGSLTIAVGGDGGNGGKGGSVTVNNGSAISTNGLQADGIDAKSIGGGGGTGGNADAYALALPVAPVNLPSVSLTVTYGGDGGGGGNGGPVSLANFSTIQTAGVESHGISAASIGGGGGAGGDAQAIADVMSLFLGVSGTWTVGGTGGGGGSGGSVAVANNGSIISSANSSSAIFAQSVGGGGGYGGTANAVANSGVSWSDLVDKIADSTQPIAKSVGLSRTVGGTGGGGGGGGAVSGSNGGSLATAGENAPAVFLQSVGGGGGVAGGYLASGDTTASLKSQTGGTGGDGGRGGAVSFSNSGAITTTGIGSIGVIAQSVGGGGGLGGNWAGSPKAVSTATGALKITQKVVQLADGIVKIDQFLSNKYGSDKENPIGEYKFLDAKSTAQQRFEAASRVLKYTKILISQDKSLIEKFQEIGVTALGYALSDALSKSAEKAYEDAGGKTVKIPPISLISSTGGKGGAGGAGGAVTVDNSGGISTAGTGSWGMFAQSVGGGGGVGGAATAAGDNKINLTSSVGGDGGAGGAGGGVTVRNSGAVSTAGGGAMGILAQSIGGGGGIGGAATSNNTVSLNLSSRIGGNAANSSDGGTVSVQNDGSVLTQGVQAHGLVAQSVGGGGGITFLNRFDPNDPANYATSAADLDAITTFQALVSALGVSTSGGAAKDTSSLQLQVGLAIGGNGSGGGNGSAVSIGNAGGITTKGEAAFGILGQSIGGGGGFGADSAAASTIAAVSASFGGKGGRAGNGGPVSLTLGDNATVTTYGKRASAVFLQSIGGGGGFSGIGTDVLGNGPIADAAASGNGGAISVAMSATDAQMRITTSGDAANGITAQSLGGGGGTVYDSNGQIITRASGGTSRGAAKGNGGAITIQTAGSITTSGSGSDAIFAQSGVQRTDGTLDPSRLGGDISITHLGTLTGGSGILDKAGAAIYVDGGHQNTITILPGSQVSAESGNAIFGTFGQEIVRNEGTITGAVDLVHGGSDEPNLFLNLPGAVFQAQSVVNLGPGTFFNDGTFRVGSLNSTSSARLTGSFFQNPTGSLVVNVTSLPPLPQAHADLLQVDGPAQLFGSIKTNVVESLRPESFQILTATGVLTAAPEVSSIEPGSPFLWSASVDKDALYVTPHANFVTPPGLEATPTNVNVMNALQRIWTTGIFDSEVAGLYGAFANATSAEDYMDGIRSFSPEEQAAPVSIQTTSARASLNAALSCPFFEGNSLLMQETSCAWGRVFGDWTQQGSTGDAAGYRQNGETYRLGVQKEVADNWFLGGTLGFTQSWLKATDGYASTTGNGVDGSASLKRQMGPWLFAGAAHFGYGNYNTSGVMTVGTDSSSTSASYNVFTGAARFRGSYEFAFDNFYIKPYLDTDFLYTYMPGYEADGSNLSMKFGSASQVNFAVGPNVEVGSRLNVSPRLWLRPYASVGMTAYAKDSLPVDAAVVGDNTELFGFTTEVHMPSTLANLAAGVQLYSTSGYELRAEYKSDIGNAYLAQEFSARVAIPF